MKRICCIIVDSNEQTMATYTYRTSRKVVTLKISLGMALREKRHVLK